jgi:hypothetical protein
VAKATKEPWSIKVSDGMATIRFYETEKTWPVAAAQKYFEKGLALCTSASKTATAAAPKGAKKKGMKGGKGY